MLHTCLRGGCHIWAKAGVKAGASGMRWASVGAQYHSEAAAC